MKPIITTLVEKKLVGKQVTTSLANDQTFQLWQSFMPYCNDIQNKLSYNFFSMQVYPPSFDFTFSDLNNTFQKWAALEVKNFDKVPDGMETFVLTGGLYAVFHYKGLSTDTAIFQYIYGTWLPTSGYSIDNRPHFEILGLKYKNNQPESEEDIWIPITPNSALGME